MSKWLPTLLPLLTTVGVALSPVAQAALMHHPVISTVLATVGAIINHLLPSPVSK